MNNNRQEIFDKEVGEYHRTLSPLNYSNVCNAMDEYAKQVAIDFGEWLSDHPLILQPSSGTGDWIGLDLKTQTTADLFTQFLKQYNQ